MRRAADSRAVELPPAADPHGRSAQTLRALIRRYEKMLSLIEGREMGLAALVFLSQCCLHGHDIARHVLHF